MKRTKGIAAGALGGVIVGFLFACLGVIGVLIAPKAAALSTYNSDCAASGCHVYRGGSLRLTTNTDNLTVAPGTSFTVGISFTGGGGNVTAVKWPSSVANNGLFAAMPQIPYSGNATAASVSSTLTAPLTAGNYTVRVYAAQRIPTMETDYKDMSITVPPTVYAISANVSPASSGNVTGAGTYMSGTTVSLVASPSRGFAFASWTENGTVVSTSASYSFAASGNRNLVANFAAAPPVSYTISTIANPITGGNVTGAGVYAAGTTVTLVAAPNLDYGFLSWTENATAVSSNASYSFVSSSNATLTANFALTSGLSQTHYRIGNDTPLAAMTWKAPTDSPATGILRGSNLRVRFQVSNNSTSDVTWQPQLEWTTASSNWTAVPVVSGLAPFFVSDTSKFSNAATISTANFTFDSGTGTAQTGQAFDTTNPAPSLMLGANSYTEIEFNVTASSTAVYYQAYGFRLTDAGVALFAYASPAWISVWEPDDPNSPHYLYSLITDKCAACHRTHTAARPSLRKMTTVDLCFSCHDGTGARTDVSSQFRLASTHPVVATAGMHSDFAYEGLAPNWNVGLRHVACDDCHAPHHGSNSGTGASTPGFGDLGNKSVGQWGLSVVNPATSWSSIVADNFTRVAALNRQYQLCLKCHSAYAYGSLVPIAPSGGFSETDPAQEFNVNNQSYHWVESDQTAVSGYTPRLADPARKASFTQGTPFTKTTPMNCTDCHASPISTAPRGPHGSSNPFILKGTWSPTAYGLCLLCHDSNVYGASGDKTLVVATSFAGAGPSAQNLHAVHLSAASSVQGCQSCHTAVPHGWKTRAMIAMTLDPAPYNGASKISAITWPSNGVWAQSNCSTASGCH